ncbi:MAG TPA: cytochrome c biogenesis protein CcdA [Myxococcales bacterium]|nr:cytochrome c biogenesis protein CcdA [Myxococcales bacterium]
MTKDRIIRLTLALAVGACLPFLPGLLSVGVGADLSGRLGLSTGVGAGTFAVLYLAGVLTSLTPCVYPLIPITVGVFGARQAGSKARAAGLSATYVAGIAVTFSALGLFAALSGKAFGTALGSPYVGAAMALFLFALAASMFGAFELTVPASIASRLGGVSGAGFAPAFGMGLVAGIVAAPCTGPVLAGVLAFVAAQRSIALGFWMLFSYAVGMGTLFFIIGVTSLKLPRSGAWMEAVKSLFGVALVAAGLGLLLPHLPRPHALPVAAMPLAILAAVLGFAAVAAGALSLSFHAPSRERLQKAAALSVLGLAVALRFGWLGAPSDAQAAGAPQIAWLHDEQAAIAQSRATGKPIVADFFAEWCVACKELDTHTWNDPAVAREVTEKFVPLKVDATEDTPEIEKLTGKYSVPGLPTVLLFACRDAAPAPRPDAECAVPRDGPGRITGFVDPPEMLQRLRRVQQ